MAEEIVVATVVKIHGIHGAVKANIHISTWHKVFEKCYLSELNRKILSSSVLYKKQCVITVDGINTTEKAYELIGRSILLKRSDIFSRNEILPRDLLGKMVYSSEKLKVGVVTKLADYGAGFLLSISNKNNTLIPVHKDFLETISNSGIFLSKLATELISLSNEP